jgi:hypothetical protein
VTIAPLVDGYPSWLTESRHRNSIAAIVSGEVVQPDIVRALGDLKITWRNHER